MDWYRLEIANTQAAERELRDLQRSLHNRLRSNRYTHLQRTIVFTREKKRGGYEVRFTEPLRSFIATAAPRKYLEKCKAPRRFDDWDLLFESKTVLKRNAKLRTA